MKNKNLAMLGVAVGCGLVAAVAVAKLSAGGNKGPETVKVLVAKKDIPLQTKLDEKELDNLLVWADMPKNLVPPDAVTDVEQVKNKELNRTLKQGNPVSVTDLGRTNKIDLPEGYKQITVKASQVDAAGGFAKPGAKVDVMFVERMNSGKTRAAIILRDMLVLAINTVHTLDEKTGAAIPQVESVSLAVTDKQATLIALADERGKLKLVLRGTDQADLARQTGDEIEWIEDPFDPSKNAPPPAVAPTADLATVVVARKPVPVNTLVNADNVNDYFTTMEVKKAPAGAVTSPDDLKGKFIVKALDEGQTLFKSLTDGRAIDPMVKVEPVPEPTPVAKLPRFEQVIQEGGRARRVIWVEVAPSKWKRFDSEKDADEYRPQTDAPKETDSAGETAPTSTD